MGSIYGLPCPLASGWIEQIGEQSIGGYMSLYIYVPTSHTFCTLGDGLLVHKFSTSFCNGVAFSTAVFLSSGRNIFSSGFFRLRDF